MTQIITTTKQFAILAPVPERHLISGMEALNEQLDADLEPRLAFGSNAFEVFTKADDLRDQCLVNIYIYASHAESPTFKPHVAWKATYLEQLHSRRGRYPGNKNHRPPTTATDKDVWGIFWLIKELEQLAQPIPIEDFRGFEKKSNYPPRFLPEGPMLVECLN